MITKPTVLILGAGASKPYGFPDGRDLKERILGDNFYANDLNKNAFFDNYFSKGHVQDFKQELRGAGVKSIDSFLKERNEFDKIGKFAITKILASCEKETNLYRDYVDSDNWYIYLLSKMDTSFENFGNNDIAIITFNYDRSLEYFLFNSLKKKYGKSDDECIKQISKIPIIHVHGQIGFLQWQNKKSIRPYGQDSKIEKILESSQNIINIHEVDEVFNNQKEDIFYLLHKAERIYFLGCQYYKENFEKLKIQDIDLNTKEEVLGTAFGLTEKEQETIRKDILGVKIFRHNAQHQRTLDFFREHITL